jgi:hypothetical protein
MFRRPALLALAVLLLLPAPSPHAQPPPNHDKSVWNYDGGLSILTDGGIPNGPCFHLTGRATAPDFFENLKREDTSLGTIIHRGNDIVTEYPAQLHLRFVMYDQSCDFALKSAGTGTHAYLTRSMVSGLRLSFYWKHGLKMRLAQGVMPAHFETRRLLPYATNLAAELPERLEWIFEFDVPSAGVPVTDSLVVIMLTPDGHIAARAAARM